MKTLTTLSLLLAAFCFSSLTQAQDMTVTSTAIISNFGTACAKKGNDTQANITTIENNNSALRGMLTQTSVVNSTQTYVPPSQYYDGCAYSSVVCGFRRCFTQCVGGWVDVPGYYQTNSRCDTTVSVNSPDYILQMVSGNDNQMNAAVAQDDVIYSDVDHGSAHWVTVTHK